MRVGDARTWLQASLVMKASSWHRDMKAHSSSWEIHIGCATTLFIPQFFSTACGQKRSMRCQSYLFNCPGAETEQLVASATNPWVTHQIAGGNAEHCRLSPLLDRARKARGLMWLA